MLRAGVPFTRAPQSQFEYSNFGYALLGRIVTNVSGRPYKDYIERRDHAPARHGLDRLRHLRRRRRTRRALGYRWENERLRPRAGHARTAPSARWAGSRPARAIMPAGSPSCSRPGRRATGRKRGRSAARPCASSPRGSTSPPSPAAPASPNSCPQAGSLRHGLPGRAGLRPRPDPGPWRRLSGLRLLSAAAARARHRHLRLRQPHLCRPVAAGLGGGARAAARRAADPARDLPVSAGAGAVPIMPPRAMWQRGQPGRRAGTGWR